MSNTNHTYGAKCRLAPVARVDREDDMPPIEAQFFYSSLIPIDDPLAAGSITGTSETRSSKSQLRPFARGDNNALEKAWLGLMSDDDRKNHEIGRQDQSLDPRLMRAHMDRLASLVQSIALRHWDIHRNGYQPQELSFPTTEALPSPHMPVCCSQLMLDVSEALDESFCAVIRRRNPAMSHDEVLKQIMDVLGRLRDSVVSTVESRSATPDIPTSRPGSGYSGNPTPTPRPAARISKKKIEPRNVGSQSPRTQTPTGSPAVARPPILDDGISGKPFIRVGSPATQTEASPATLLGVNGPIVESPQEDGQKSIIAIEASHSEAAKEEERRPDVAEVAVGVSRLHMVSLPMLQMKPIYWSPVNDIAVVMRATWFYRDTMLPIPPTVANQLEAGYHELKPWTQTWKDEIRCAIDVGPLGEEKVSHKLWSEGRASGPKDKGATPDSFISSDPYCAARCFRGEAATEGSLIETLVGGKAGATESHSRPFSNYHVIYKNATEAFLLKPSLKPSAYYGRRPLFKITKGLTVGVPVVRGFDLQAWEQIHDRNKKTPKKPAASAANESHESSGHGVCSACRAEKERGQVTDLVLVAHGIGQKFAERVESFHFTHAINGFRRAVNVELQSSIVQHVLREGQNGLMILPLNWRMGLSFEDGGPMREEDKAEYTPEGFGLKDIEPDTIPAVRSMISDVMFDIPFYMSHHKSKMIQALVSEANRVYRLWCRNNPGFAEKGRVHMIGHSLGSAMCIEILSKQPTLVPRIDLSRKEPETRFFEFDTGNLFLVGSPAGFFLLLEKGTLLPRYNRSKPGADPSDIVAKDVVGQKGTFGCLAVDNIYNILAKEDPIAYLLNGAVDPNYASSLKVAYVPSTTGSLWKSVGDAMRTVVPGMAPAQNPLVPEPERPSTVRLPSQLELEVHDFTREEIVEKKAFLLNDNGQIDWYLRSSGGPLEIQYLNMLSAHTSYWYNHDFIRMLCIEIGRRPGRAHTLPAMRAIKAAKRLLVN
ncbi:Fc.00g029740.m01.CDS01 [Cosmosporella sp. VM-42]